MAYGNAWQPWELRVLKNAYQSGGRAAAVQALPHRTPDAVAMKAYQEGYTVLAPKPGPKPITPLRPEAAAIEKVSAPQSTSAAPRKPLTRDQREAIRKRIVNFVARDLAREIGLHPVRVLAEIKDLAGKNFTQDTSLQTMTKTEAESSAYPSSSLETAFTRA